MQWRGIACKVGHDAGSLDRRGASQSCRPVGKPGMIGGIANAAPVSWRLTVSSTSPARLWKCSVPLWIDRLIRSSSGGWVAKALNSELFFELPKHVTRFGGVLVFNLRAVMRCADFFAVRRKPSGFRVNCTAKRPAEIPTPPTDHRPGMSCPKIRPNRGSPTRCPARAGIFVAIIATHPQQDPANHRRQTIPKMIPIKRRLIRMSR